MNEDDIKQVIERIEAKGKEIGARRLYAGIGAVVGFIIGVVVSNLSHLV